MIYFITAREIGRVKIGYSADPYLRLKNMQTGSPVKILLERLCEGGVAEERAIHATFAAYRADGEWFHIVPLIEQFMSGLIEPTIARRRKSLNGALGQWLVDNNVTMMNFAALVGASHASISRVCSGKQDPSVKLIRAIVAATDGKITADALLFGEAA